MNKTFLKVRTLFMKKPRVLFLVKKSQKFYSYSHNSSGLFNSARFVSDMLNQNSAVSEIVEVVDANSIDREVNRFKPNIAIIEAYWVTPAKFVELKKLHPKVKFIVRNHSKPEFLAQEGMAFEWSLEYLAMGISIACNSPEMVYALKSLCSWDGTSKDRIFYLPNYYIDEQNSAVNKCLPRANPTSEEREVLNIGCFGAIRPLKNNINQAIAAIKVADAYKMKLKFHVNSSRVEGGAENIVKNLHAIFHAQGGEHELVEHAWLDHGDFLGLVKKMDIVSQVSFSETFNIVCADAIVSKVPVVVSPQVCWVDDNVVRQPDPTDVMEIYLAFHQILRLTDTEAKDLLVQQHNGLDEYNASSRVVWLEYVFNNKTTAGP